MMPLLEFGFRKFCVHVKLAVIDQTFTAKDLGRGVINTCSTGTPVVLVVLAVPVPVPVPEYIQTFIGLYRTL